MVDVNSNSIRQNLITSIAKRFGKLFYFFCKVAHSAGTRIVT